jgi:hypothetical protein
MAIANILFVVLVGLILYNNGVQAYIHYEAYPLIPFVGKGEFATYMTEYEKRLNIPLLAPYGLTLLANIALLFTRPIGISVISIIILLALNMAVAVVTMVVATPVYNELKAGTAVMPRLMTINLLRLVLSTVSSVVALYLLYTIMPVSA